MKIILASMLWLGVLSTASYSGWMRGYGSEFSDAGYSVRQTADGGYIIGGVTFFSDDSYSDLLLIKTDSLGDTLWSKVYGGNGSDVATCVQQTKDGGYIVTGHLGPVLWLLKTDSKGDTVWTRTYGSWCSGNWVEQTSDGGYIVTGSLDQTYLWLLKTDEDGFKEWEKTYEWGDYHETGYCIRPTNGGYIVATNMGLFGTDDKGDSLWLKPWVVRCVQQTTDYGYILTGARLYNQNDVWLVKTDWMGDTVWTRTYGGDNGDAGLSVQQTTDGGYIVVGVTTSFGAGNYDAWLLKTDSNGDTLWTRTYGGTGTDEAYSCQQTVDGGYIIAGSTTFFSGDWRPDVLLIKTDSLGYVGVEEPVTPPITRQPGWEVVSSVGRTITLRYTDRPEGFRASIYDATGRRVDEIQSINQSGTLTWPVTPGEGMLSGVYFVREESEHNPTTRKVILIR